MDSDVKKCMKYSQLSVQRGQWMSPASTGGVQPAGSVTPELLAALYLDLQHASKYAHTHTHNKKKPALVGRVVSSRHIKTTD